MLACGLCPDIDQRGTDRAFWKACCRYGRLVFSPGTNEAHHSLILIPFDLTHFIDSPCAPNEMLNLSPVAAGPRGYCYGDRERTNGGMPQHGRRSIKSSALPPSLARFLFLCVLHVYLSCINLEGHIKMEQIREHSGWSLFLGYFGQFVGSLRVVLEFKQPFNHYYLTENHEKWTKFMNSY